MSMSSNPADYDRFDQLAEEFVERFRRGERPSLQEYIDQLPEMASEIREMFPAMVEVEQAEREARGEEGHAPVASILRQIGDYRILRQVGRGGMGVVYEAEQISLGRRVALKVLPGPMAADRRALQRFRREARAAARLHHTNIVPVYEVGSDGDIAFYAMQFIQGLGLNQVVGELNRIRESSQKFQHGSRESVHAPPRKSDLVHAAESLLTGRLASGGLESELRKTAASSDVPETEPAPSDGEAGLSVNQIDDLGPASTVHDGSGSAMLPGGTLVSAVDATGRLQPYFRSVAQIGRQVAQGLAYAHARGIVHRDIKPSNLLLDTAGVVWITDFGLAKTEDNGLTATGDILGTVRYMAPERFHGKGDARADIYALGLTLYELLTLRPAFETQNKLKLIEQIKTQDPIRPRLLDDRIPRDLETIVLKAIDKEPERRYSSARAMAEDMRRFLADEPILARRASLPERYWRWAHRNPVIAVLGAVLTAVLVLASIGSLIAANTFRLQAEAQSLLASKEAAARAKADEANSTLRAKDEELGQTVYGTRSNLALAAWQTDDVGQLRTLLGLMKPTAGERDLRGWEWRYLWGLGHEDRLSLPAYSEADKFVDIAFSPGGESLASLGQRGRIEFWDPLSGRLRRTIGLTPPGEARSLSRGAGCIAFSPDGQTLAGPGAGFGLVLYDVQSGEATRSFELGVGAVLDLAWSPDGHTLVASFSTHIMRAWDSRDGHLIKQFGGHDGPVTSVSFSPDGKTLASGGFDGKVKVWDVADGFREIAVLDGHTDEVHAVAISPDGRRIVSASRDRTVRVWNARSGTPLEVIRGHHGLVTSLCYFPDGRRIATGSSDETVRVWDTATGEELRRYLSTDDIGAVAVSPDGLEIAAAGDVLVRLWDLDAPPRLRTLSSPSVLKYGGGVICLAFSPDGRRLVSGHDDHALRVWDLESGGPPRILKGHNWLVRCVAFSPDGSTIASASADKTVRLWNAETGEPGIVFSGHDDQVQALAFSPDGGTVFSGGYDRTIHAWDAATGKDRYVLDGHSDSICGLAFSPDGLTLASASDDATCILWDLSARRPRLTIRGHADSINDVDFSPDGRTVVTASDDDTVRTWDAVDGTPRHVMLGHLDDVNSVTYSRDGRIASSGFDKTVRVWDPSSEQALLILKGHAGNVPCVRFSPDGRILASASFDRTIRLREAAPEEVLSGP